MRELLTHPVLFLLLGGAAGTYARYRVAAWVKELAGAADFPYGTLLINVTGSFVLGAAAVLVPARVPAAQQAHWYLFVGTGFCGGYTTFSTFELETLHLVRDGQWGLALLNVLVSSLAGFAAVVLAVKLASLAVPRP